MLYRTTKISTEWLAADRQSDLSTKLEEANSATFTLNLSGRGGSTLFPKTLNLTARKIDIFGHPRISIDSFAASDPNDQSKSDYMISADWGAPEDKFTFSFSSSFLDDRLVGGESADINDDMLSFTRTLRTGGWLSSFTASVGRGYREETGNRERTQKIGASANFKSMLNGPPHFDITAKVRQDRTRGMSRLLLKLVQQALLVEQATQRWPAVQVRG